MRTGKRRAFAAGAAAVAVGCVLAGPARAAATGPASAAPSRPDVVRQFAVAGGSVTTSGATFTWAPDPRAVSYRVIIASASTPYVGNAYDSGYRLNGTSVTVTSLQPGTAYEASISAENPAGTSSWVQPVVFYTTAESGIVWVKTYSLVTDASGDSENIPTGGSFTARARSVGQVALTAGTYLLSLNFRATPNATTTGEVFPQAFVYNGTTIAADFSNDLFSIGSGALAPYEAAGAGDQVSSYYSGTMVITVPASGETVDVYGFGYDADHGAGSYEMNSATVTATELSATPAAS